MLSHAIPCYPMPSHAIPCYPMLSHSIPCYPMLSHAIPCYPMLSHAIPGYPMLSHAIPCHPMLSHAIPCYPMPSHAIPCYPMLSHAIPCYPMLSHAIPCHPMLSHAIPCYPMLSHAIPCYPVLSLTGPSSAKVVANREGLGRYACFSLIGSATRDIHFSTSAWSLCSLTRERSKTAKAKSRTSISTRVHGVTHCLPSKTRASDLGPSHRVAGDCQARYWFVVNRMSINRWRAVSVYLCA